MGRFRAHPVLTFALGVLAGYMFSSQVARVPGVSRLPKP